MTTAEDRHLAELLVRYVFTDGQHPAAITGRLRMLRDQSAAAGLGPAAYLRALYERPPEEHLVIWPREGDSQPGDWTITWDAAGRFRLVPPDPGDRDSGEHSRVV